MRQIVLRTLLTLNPKNLKNLKKPITLVNLTATPVGMRVNADQRLTTEDKNAVYQQVIV